MHSRIHQNFTSPKLLFQGKFEFISECVFVYKVFSLANPAVESKLSLQFCRQLKFIISIKVSSSSFFSLVPLLTPLHSLVYLYYYVTSCSTWHNRISFKSPPLLSSKIRFTLELNLETWGLSSRRSTDTKGEKWDFGLDFPTLCLCMHLRPFRRNEILPSWLERFDSFLRRRRRQKVKVRRENLTSPPMPTHYSA